MQEVNSKKSIILKINLLTRKNRARKKEILMELQKVNVKDFDPSTLKEGEILDIPRYQELSLVLKALESETIKDNINSEFIEEAKEFVRYWSISTPDFSRDTNEDSARKRKVTTLGIYYSEDKGFRVMFDPKYLNRISPAMGQTSNLLPRIGLDFFVESLDILDIESEDKLLESLKKRAEKSLSRAKNNDNKSAKNVVDSHSYLDCFNNKAYKKEADKKIIKLFKKVIKSGFELYSNETIIFLKSWNDGVGRDVKDKLKKLSLETLKQKEDGLYILFKKVYFLNKVLEKDDLHQFLNDTNVLKDDYLSSIRLLERYIVINKEIFFDVLNILDEFSLAYQENWLKTEGINGFKFKLLMEYPLYMMEHLYNNFKTYEDCEKFSSDLLEGALELSDGEFAIKFHRLVAYINDKLFDFISDKNYKYTLVGVFPKYKEEYVGTFSKPKEGYRLVLESLDRLINDFDRISTVKLGNNKILVPRGSKSYIQGVLELKGSYDELKDIVENNLEEVEPEVLKNFKKNHIVLD